MTGPVLRQSFAWWAFVPGKPSSADAAQLLRAAADIGYAGVDFLPPDFWPLAREAGLAVTVIDGHVPLEIGFNDRARHADLARQVRTAVAAAAGDAIPFVAVASGDRLPGRFDGLDACAEALAPLADEAAAAGVTLLIEPLNSRIDHPGHECERTDWAARLVERVGSPGLRILYDFYHAQIMEGDLFRTVEANLPRIAHVHTAGVPGRHDLDGTQEIDWSAVARFLRGHGFPGYVAHEFLPRGAPIPALRAAFAIFAPADA